MERLDAILSRVLADVGAEFATEDKGRIGAAVSVPGEVSRSAGKDAAIGGTREDRMTGAVTLPRGSPAHTSGECCRSQHARRGDPKTTEVELSDVAHAEAPTWGSMDRRNQVRVAGIRAHVRSHTPGNDNGPPLDTVEENVQSS